MFDRQFQALWSPASVELHLEQQLQDRAGNEPSHLALCLNVKAQVGSSNQEKALVRAFSMIVKLQSSRRFVSSSIRHTSPIIQICSRFPLHSPDIVAAH